MGQGPLTDRRQTFPRGWGVNRDKPYRTGRDALGKLRKAVGVQVHPFRSVSARHRPSQSSGSPRHAGHCKISHRRAHASPGRIRMHRRPAHAANTWTSRIVRATLQLPDPSSLGGPVTMARSITQKTRMQRRGRDESDETIEFAASESLGPQGFSHPTKRLL